VLELQYAEALSTVICDDKITDNIRSLRVMGLNRLASYLMVYSKEGIIQTIVVNIWLEKAPFILEATKKSEISEILEISIPRYDGNKYRSSGKYHSEAEELILLSKTSLLAPLNHDAYKRYVELFGKYFPAETEEIFS
jgi:hypothetical protein